MSWRKILWRRIAQTKQPLAQLPAGQGKAAAVQIGMSNASIRMKYPSKRMKGLALIASVATQLVVANTKAADFMPPSGNKPQAKVAQAAMTSSVRMPALATRKR